MCFFVWLILCLPIRPFFLNYCSSFSRSTSTIGAFFAQQTREERNDSYMCVHRAWTAKGFLLGASLFLNVQQQRCNSWRNTRRGTVRKELNRQRLKTRCFTRDPFCFAADDWQTICLSCLQNFFLPSTFFFCFCFCAIFHTRLRLHTNTSKHAILFSLNSLRNRSSGTACFGIQLLFHFCSSFSLKATAADPAENRATIWAEDGSQRPRLGCGAHAVTGCIDTGEDSGNTRTCLEGSFREVGVLQPARA